MVVSNACGLDSILDEEEDDDDDDDDEDDDEDDEVEAGKD